MTKQPTILFDETPHQRAERLENELLATHFCIGALINVIDTTATLSQRQTIIDKLNKKVANPATTVVSDSFDATRASDTLKRVIATLTPNTHTETQPYIRAVPSQTVQETGSEPTENG